LYAQPREVHNHTFSPFLLRQHAMETSNLKSLAEHLLLI